MDYIKYLNALIGKKTVDTDGVYGVQCVDLVKRMLKDYLGIKNVPPLGNGKDVAKNVAKKFPKLYNYIPYSDDLQILPGDTISYNSKTSPAYGHVGIALTCSDSKGYYYMLEQWNGSGTIRKSKRKVAAPVYGVSYTIIGVARPIYAENDTPETETQDVVVKTPEIEIVNTENSQAEFKVGDKVRVKNGAETYDGKGLKSFVYTTTYSVLQVGTKGKPDYIVFGLDGKITAAVHAEDLIKV